MTLNLMNYLYTPYPVEIDLDKVDRVLYGDYNSMYEIKNPVTDIQCRVKLR